MSKQTIQIITIGHFDSTLLTTISSGIKDEFNLPTLFIESHLDLSDFYDPSRRQYNANEILKKIGSLYLFKALKTIGLLEVDLFIPVLTYIFGQAVFKGNTGLASIYRLRNEQYGMKPDENLLFNRFKKVVIHEIGHTFGLVHCYNPSCVMRSSTYVEDIDQKGDKLCSSCKEKFMQYLP